jgi:hypothetical protein
MIQFYPYSYERLLIQQLRDSTQRIEQTASVAIEQQVAADKQRKYEEIQQMNRDRESPLGTVINIFV